MPRSIPWRSAEELATILSWERDALNRQITALNTSRDPNDQTARLEILLCKYLVLGSAKRAVDWANEQGWRLDSVKNGKANTREWQPKDLSNAITADGTALPGPLVELCRRVFYPNQDKAFRGMN